MKADTDHKQARAVALARRPVSCLAANALHFSHAQWRSLSRRGFAVVGALFYFFLSLVSVDHALHECLHENAGQPDHECVLTLLSQGQIEAGQVTVEPAVQTTRFIAFSLSHEILPTPVMRGLPPSRGPPTV
jgi:hypothetical protein